MNNLKEHFFKYFEEISNIPRKSGYENLIADYLCNFAEKHNLKYYKDQLFNVIIYKPASNGYENKEPLALQSHTDMICEKANGIEHDFLNEPLDIYVDGDYVKARETTLGADNGVGVAYMLAILASNEILSPKLECIFTSQEETTMNGAREIDLSKISSNKIISFDNFSENDMWISSSNCKEYMISIFNEYKILDRCNTYKILFDNFPGGHSGLDIEDINRVNTIKLMVEILNKIENIYINKIVGGSRVNIIPRDCYVEFSTVKNIDEKMLNYIKEKYPKAIINIEKIKSNRKVISNTKEILQFISGFENGFISKDNIGNVVVSANMGVIESQALETFLKYSVRINDKIVGDSFVFKLEEEVKKSEFKIKEFSEMLGYESKENSSLVKYCANEYFKIFGKNINKIKVQACLECGFFANKIKDLEYISISPNIYNAHSPSECFSISSSIRIWKYIISLLKNW